MFGIRQDRNRVILLYVSFAGLFYGVIFTEISCDMFGIRRVGVEWYFNMCLLQVSVTDFFHTNPFRLFWHTAGSGGGVEVMYIFFRSFLSGFFHRIISLLTCLACGRVGGEFWDDFFFGCFIHRFFSIKLGLFWHVLHTAGSGGVLRWQFCYCSSL